MKIVKEIAAALLLFIAVCAMFEMYEPRVTTEVFCFLWFVWLSSLVLSFLLLKNTTKL